MSDDLRALRDRIRAIDDQILSLVRERVEVAKSIGAIKTSAGLPIKDYQVEKDVLARARQRAQDIGLYEELATDLSKLLIRYAVIAQDEFRQQQAVNPTMPPSQILIAGGLGRMGRWLAEFFASFGHEVSLFDPQGVSTALSTPAQMVDDFGAAARAADIIVLSTPISATADMIEQLIPLQPHALIFDICSLKSPLLNSIAKAQAAGLRIASVHPMFGPQVEVLADRNIVICDCGDAQSATAARTLFERTSARLVSMPIADHDHLMSGVLGLSHLCNLVFGDALMRSGIAFERLVEVASTTFRAQLAVTVPVVNENADLYYEIQSENAHMPGILDAFAEAFAAYRTAISRHDKASFVQLMQQSRQGLTQSEPTS